MHSGDKVTKVEYRKKPGFFERLGKSCSGILIGICMLFCSFVILYNNEGWSVNTAATLDEASKEVVSFDASSKLSFESKLVHHQGVLQTNEEIFDSFLRLHFKCVSLHRKVETYQWVEYNNVEEIDEGDKVRSETTYSYSTEWRNELISSRNFAEEVGHRNPTEKLMKDETYFASGVAVDGIRVPSRMLHLINWHETINSLPAISNDLGLSKHLQFYYQGKDPTRPEVGNTRVSFQCAGIPQGSSLGQPDMVSVIAVLNGQEFSPYKTKNGNTLEFLFRGSKSIKEIFDSQYASASARTWLLRGFGSILMFVSLSIMSRVIVTLVDWIPIVREVVTFSIVLFNFTLASFLSLITIAFSWIWFRPITAAALFAAACLPWYISRKRARAYLAR